MSEQIQWGSLELEPAAERVLAIGTLRLEVERTRTELWLRVARANGEGVEAEPEWTRWATAPGSDIVLQPAVPDRLLVVSHEHPFHLPPNAQARVYVRIPLHAQVLIKEPDGSEVIALDAGSYVLSDTWWGSFTDGELAYWLITKARAQVTDALFEPHLAMCPFQLSNESGEPLPIERFAVRVPHLTIYQRGHQQWTDEVQVRYQGAAEGSEIDFGGQPPPECEDAVEVAPPRERSERGLRARTFDRLKSLSPLGS